MADNESKEKIGDLSWPAVLLGRRVQAILGKRGVNALDISIVLIDGVWHLRVNGSQRMERLK